MSSETSGATIREQRVEANGVDFAYLEAGEGPLAICMHGFPDCAWGWSSLLPELADAGFHAVAPFARGYAPTSVPDGGLSPIGAWVADLVAFHEILGGGEPGVLVGHDWGALATYGAAAHAPERWRRIVAASVPPTAVMAPRLFTYDQLKAFWYQFFFLQPTAEMVVGADNLAFVDRLWADWSPGYGAGEAIAHVKHALHEPANLTAALSTYRTTYDPGLQPVEFSAEQVAVFGSHTQPTLYLHGATDGCVPAIAPSDFEGVFAEGSRVEMVEGAGHFLQYEQPAVVNALIIEFLTET